MPTIQTNTNANLYYNSEKNAWVFNNLNNFNQTVIANILQYGQPYHIADSNNFDVNFYNQLKTTYQNNPNAISSPRIILPQSDTMFQFGKGVKIEDFAVSTKFNLNNSKVKNLSDGVYIFQELVKKGILTDTYKNSNGDLIVNSGDNIITTNFYGYAKYKNLVSDKPILDVTTALPADAWVKAAYILGSVKFELSSDTKFIKSNGKTWIEGSFGLQGYNPYGSSENFDFESGDGFAKFLNPILEFASVQSGTAGSLYPKYQEQLLIEFVGTGKVFNTIYQSYDFKSYVDSISLFNNNASYTLGKTITNSFNSFSSLTTFESTSKIGDFSLSGSNTLNTLPTTNPIVKNFGFIIGNSSNYVSPLTFDLDGDGIESNHIYSQKVYFDIDADGFAEKVGWIKADDGQLAFDANKNGKIDDITELFGDDKEPAFDKLKRFDTNKNGKIDAGDAKFGELLVWRDHSQDGKTNAGELKTLTETNIKEISLNEVKENTYQNENYISGRAKYTLTNGTQRDIADVHFLNDNINTWFQGAQSQEFGNNFTIDPTTLLMPLSRGYGSLPSLHIAITQNANDNSVKYKLQSVA